MEIEKKFKNNELETLWQEFLAPAEKELTSVFEHHLKDIVRLINAYKNRFEKLYESINDEEDYIRYLKQFNSSLLELLGKYQEEVINFDYNALFNPYLEILDQKIQKLPPVLQRNELLSVYPLSKNDTLTSIIKKVGLNIVFMGSLQAKKTRNLIRKIRKLPPKSLDTFINRDIPYQSMVMKYEGVELLRILTNHMHRLMKQNTIVLFNLWKFDEVFDRNLQSRLSGKSDEALIKFIKVDEMNLVVEKLKNDISDLKKEIKGWVETAFHDTFMELDGKMQIVNSPDLSGARFHESKLTIEKEVVNRKLLSGIRNFNNAQVTLFDDWGVDVEIVLLYYSVLVYSSDLQEKIDEFIQNQLSVNFDELSAFIKASTERIQKSSSSSKKLEAALKVERDLINSELIDKMISKMIEKLSGSFLDDLETFRNRTINHVSKVSDKRGFIKNENYEKGVKDSEIDYISPRDLINFEAMPHFEEAILQVKKLVSSSMEKVRLKLLSMGTVCDFSLESAGLFLEQKKNSIKSAEKVALEGYERALLHVEEAVSLVEVIRTQPLEKLQSAIHEFNAEIQVLKNTENIFELNIRIARIRALERSKKVRRDTIAWIRGIIPEIHKSMTQRFAETNNFLDRIKSRIGMTVEKKQISYEVSEFLSQTETALQKLPFVYQRLYQIKPTDEDRFFVGRIKEFDQLQKGFTDWTLGRFVIVSVIGEKGSGVTSFLSVFKRKNLKGYSVLHTSPESKIYLPEQYFNFFATLLGVEKFESNQQIIDYLNALPDKKVIIIEALHHFFLKIVNGFDCQKMLFELMSNTAKMIFWIGTYTTHSWEYFDKTINISDYFVRNIRLENLKSENLTEIIYKRNNLSGYKVQFEKPDELNDSRSFEKMDEVERLNHLKTRYFTNLTNLSNGNVSLAQLYWLRSTRNVTEDTISVGSVYEIDLSFVKDVKSEHLFALYTILVHDGLTLKDYSKVFNLSESGCRNILIPMLEKGLLIRPKEKFNINPVIFRQVVSYLSSRNFIS